MSNRKGVANEKKKQRKKAIKDYQEDKRFDLKYLLVLQCYVFIFFLLSICNDSTFLSLILSIFSLITTFCFEILEWFDYKSKSISSRFINYILKHKTMVMLMIPILFLGSMIPLIFWNKIDVNSYIHVAQTIDSHIPNILTSITFALYFFSFYLRSYFKKRDTFLESFNKEFHQPYNK